MSAHQPTQMYLPWNTYVNTYLLHFLFQLETLLIEGRADIYPLRYFSFQGLPAVHRYALPIQLDIWGIINAVYIVLSIDSCFSLDVSFPEHIKTHEQKSLISVQLRQSIFNFAAAWGSSFRAIHHVFEKSTRGRGLQMWEVGFWLHWQLWGTEVSQSRKWLDLPCGRLAHPDNNPHSFEHPGSPQAPTEGGGAAQKRQGRLDLPVQASKTWNLDGAVTPTGQNRTKDDSKTFKGIVSVKSFKIKMPVAPLLLRLFRTTCQLTATLYVTLESHVLPITVLHNRKLIQQVIC